MAAIHCAIISVAGIKLLLTLREGIAQFKSSHLTTNVLTLHEPTVGCEQNAPTVPHDRHVSRVRRGGNMRTGGRDEDAIKSKSQCPIYLCLCGAKSGRSTALTVRFAHEARPGFQTVLIFLRAYDCTIVR